MPDQIKIRLTRGSVSFGDDINGPHEEMIYFDLHKNLAELASEISRQRYLPRIYGGNATWIMKNGETKISMVAEQWMKPKFLIDEKLTIDELTKTSDCVNIHFIYLAQQNPDIIFQDLRLM